MKTHHMQFDFDNSVSTVLLGQPSPLLSPSPNSEVILVGIWIITWSVEITFLQSRNSVMVKNRSFESHTELDPYLSYCELSHDYLCHLQFSHQSLNIFIFDFTPQGCVGKIQIFIRHLQCTETQQVIRNSSLKKGMAIKNQCGRLKDI